MNDQLQSIKDKIRAILAKAESTEHEGERALFIAKAAELMEKHQIELFELHVDDPIGETWGLTGQPGPVSYKTRVQGSLARYYGCEAIQVGNSKLWRMQLVGPESSRITTELMTDFVWAQVCAEGGKMNKETGKERGACIREIAKALCIRIARLIREREAQHQQVGPQDGSCFSLAVVDALALYIKQKFPDLRYSRPRPVKYSKSAQEHAAGIKINQQFDSTQALRLK